MKPLERAEQPLGIRHVKARAVVGHEVHRHAVLLDRPEANASVLGDSGPSWIATPSMSDSSIPNFIPVYPGILRTYVLFRCATSAVTITEHDPTRPWMVLSTEHRTIKLPDGMDFFTWAREQWPAPRWSVQVDPWELSPR